MLGFSILYDQEGIKEESLCIWAKTYYSWTFAKRPLTCDSIPCLQQTMALTASRESDYAVCLPAPPPDVGLICSSPAELLGSNFNSTPCQISSLASTQPSPLSLKLIKIPPPALAKHNGPTCFLGFVTKDPEVLCLQSFIVVQFDGASHITHGHHNGVPIRVSVF